MDLSQGASANMMRSTRGLKLSNAFLHVTPAYMPFCLQQKTTYGQGLSYSAKVLVLAALALVHEGLLCVGDAQRSGGLPDADEVLQGL